ncbi:MAG: hypothetical protein HQ488_04420 [Parcubacteria group bacterium]|nr:hypothetical protein [Parcubacteria group bacterium]
MKLHHIIFGSMFMFALAVLPAHAEGSWVQKEYGTIQGLQGIAQIGDTYFAAGNTGNIIRSTDDGETWSAFDQSASVYWQDMGVFGSYIWAIGEGGAMRESQDSGSTWAGVTTGVSEVLYDMDTSTLYGYLVGSGGRIMAYHTDARLWLAVTSDTTSVLYRVQDRGDATAWVVGGQGILLYTLDAGQTWTNKGNVATDDLYGVWFTSATEGYVVGRNGTFRKTIDAGASWTTIAVSGLSSQSLYDIRGSGDDLVIAGDKILIRSEDAGVTWSVTDYTTENYTFRNALFSDEGPWVVGTNYDMASVMLRYEQSGGAGSGSAGEEEVVEEEEETVLLVPVEAEPGTLIKKVCLEGATATDPCRAVYYYATDGMRHAFPNEKVFFTWFDDFDSVVDVSADFLSDIQLGSNVTYHPGTRMVKFLSVPTVYTVSIGSELRSIASEEIAVGMYGDDWNQQIDDISDAFYGNYSFGEPIEAIEDYIPELASEAVSSLDDNF